MGWGSSTRRGGGRKVRALLESLSSLGFEERNLGCPENFAGISRTPAGLQKVCAKKVCVHFLNILARGRSRNCLWARMRERG